MLISKYTLYKGLHHFSQVDKQGSLGLAGKETEVEGQWTRRGAEDGQGMQSTSGKQTRESRIRDGRKFGEQEQELG